MADPNTGHESVRTDAVWGSLAALLSLAIAAWILRLGSWTPRTPLSLEGDGTFVAMQLRDLDDHGWYWWNPDLGFPYGQNGAVFPELNVLHMAIVKLLGAFAADPYTPGVIYFVLGFPLAAVAMYALARSQDINPRAAMVVGVLFALAPGHQERFGHLWLASYWTVPLGIWIVLSVTGWRGGGTPDAITAPRDGPRIVLLVLACVAVGLSGVYYVAFTLILLVVATLIRRMSGQVRDWMPGLAALAVLGGTAMVPLLVARVGAGSSVTTGDAATERSPAESEAFAGKAMDLLLPWEGHRVGFLSHLTSAYKAVQPSTVETAALGAVALAGCILLGIVVVRALTLRSPDSPRLRVWALYAGVAFAFYTIGGLGSFTALFVTPQVRTWSRLSLYIMLFALLAVGWWLSRQWRRRGAVTGSVLCAVVLVVGVLDQTNEERAPQHELLSEEFNQMATYGAELSNGVGPGCAVFQLPVVQFPESAGTDRLSGYDQLLPYLASRGLKWSFGAMKGTTAAEWQLAAGLDEVERWIKGLSAAGFCAVEVNSAGFEPVSDPREALERNLGEPLAESPNGILTAYRLPTPSEDPTNRTRLLEPVVVSLDGHEIRLVDGEPHQWVGPRAQIRATNLSNRTVLLAVSMYVQPMGEQARQIMLKDDRGQTQATFQLSAGTRKVLDFEMPVVPGTTTYELSLTGDPVQLRKERVTVSGEVSNLQVMSTADVRVVSLQQQVAAGVVIP